MKKYHINQRVEAVVERVLPFGVFARLDENTEAAYIFNPKLDVLQLLKAINDEFGIASDTDSVKALIDRLNTFLLEQRAKDKRVLLPSLVCQDAFVLSHTMMQTEVPELEQLIDEDPHSERRGHAAGRRMRLVDQPGGVQLRQGIPHAGRR